MKNTLRNSIVFYEGEKRLKKIGSLQRERKSGVCGERVEGERSARGTSNKSRQTVPPIDHLIEADEHKIECNQPFPSVVISYSL